MWTLVLSLLHVWSRHGVDVGVWCSLVAVVLSQGEVVGVDGLGVVRGVATPSSCCRHRRCLMVRMWWVELL